MARIELTAAQNAECLQILLEQQKLSSKTAGYCRECNAPLAFGVLHRVVKWKTVDGNGYRRSEQDGYLCKKHENLS
jgi:hypothetical protein